MASTKFSKRFKELVADMSDTELGFILGVSATAAGKMRSGDIKSLKLQAALRLARELQISPWYLGGEPEPIKQHSADGIAKGRDGSMASLHLSQPAHSETAEHERILQEVARLRERVGRMENALKQSKII